MSFYHHPQQEQEYEHQHKKKFFVCDESGQCLKVVYNKFPAGAARKGASEGLTTILVFSPDKQKWYAYMGKRLKIKAKDLTDHQRQYGMKYKTKVYRQPFNYE
jgi:hypothetical protein